MKRLCIPSTIIKENDIDLDKDEFYLLFNFFITNSLCKNQSKRNKSLKDYGYKKINEVKGIKDIFLIDNINFDISSSDTLLSEELINYNLLDDKIFDITYERGLIINYKESNNYYNYFHAIRNSLAHGEYTIKLNEKNEKVLIMQNSEGNSIKARIIIKVDTLIKIIKIIDKNKILYKE